MITLLTIILITWFWTKTNEVGTTHEYITWDGTGEGQGYQWPNERLYYVNHWQKAIRARFISMTQLEGMSDRFRGILASDKADLLITLKWKNDLVKFLLPFLMKGYVNDILHHSFLFMRTTNNVEKQMKVFWNKHGSIVCWITGIRYKLVMAYSKTDIAELTSNDTVEIVIDIYAILGVGEFKEKFQFNIYWSGNIPKIDDIQYTRPIVWEYADE